MAYANNFDTLQTVAGPEPTVWLYDDKLHLGGVKLYLDGALGSRGAWLKKPYSDAPGQTGLPLLTGAELRNEMVRASMDGFQVAVHAIGDAANAEMIDAVEDMVDTYSGDQRWRIEHAQIVDPADIAKGIGLSVAAAQADGGRAWFSGYGSQISLAAYGAYDRTSGPAGLLAGFPRAHAYIEDFEPGNPDADPPIPDTPACGCRVRFAGSTRYAYLAGTSMAAPQVTAVAALMRHLNPALTPAQVERMIKRTAQRPAGTGWTQDLGWGVLDAGAALEAARDARSTRKQRH